MLYYEMCERIWGGSPATEQIETGLESTDVGEAYVPPTESVADREEPSGDEGELDDGEGGSAREPNEQAAVGRRRELLNDKLKNFRQEKLKRKLPVDAQLLECAKEELQVKK